MTDREREGWEKALSDCFDSSVQEGGAAGWNEVCDRLAVRRRRRVAARSAIALCCSALVLGGLFLSLRPNSPADGPVLLAQGQSVSERKATGSPAGGAVLPQGTGSTPAGQEAGAEPETGKALAKGGAANGGNQAVQTGATEIGNGGASGVKKAVKPGSNIAETGSGIAETGSGIAVTGGGSFDDAPFKTGDVLALAEELPGRRRGPQIGVGLEIGGMPATSGTLNISGGVAANSVQRFESPGVEVFQASAEAISSSATYRHHMPLGAGLKLNIGLTERLSLTTGLNYTLLWSELQPLGSEGKSDQYLHYIGVPLGAEYHLLSKGAFALSAGAGISLDFLAAAYIDRRKVDDKPLQWTANLNAAAHWELSSHLSLYLQPELNWYISKTGVNSIRNDSPLGATLRIGLRLDL